MKSLNDLTVIIVTFNTPKKVIFDCLNSISKDVNILIVENSDTFINKDLVLKKFANVDVVCTGENLGYGRGNNYGLNLVKTNKALILNPDVICDKDFFINICDVVVKAKDFAIIGCQYSNDTVFMPAGYFEKGKNINFTERFRANDINSLENVEWVTGCSMLINLEKFENKEIFDKNFFLYFEEFDLCRSLIKKGEKIFTASKLKIHHLGFKSSLNDDHINNFKIISIKEWHFMWSSFYFYKKNYSYFFALRKVLGKFLRSFFKMVFYSITIQKKNRSKYFYRFLGLSNAILGKPSSFRG